MENITNAIDTLKEVKSAEQTKIEKIQDAIVILEGVEIATTNNDSNDKVQIDNEDKIETGSFDKADDLEKESSFHNAARDEFNEVEVGNSEQKSVDEVEASAPGSVDEAEASATGPFDEEASAPGSFDEVEASAPGPFEEVEASAPRPFEKVAVPKPLEANQQEEKGFIANTISGIKKAFEESTQQAAGRRRNRKSRKGLRTKRFRGGKNRKTRRGRRNSRRLRK